MRTAFFVYLICINFILVCSKTKHNSALSRKFPKAKRMRIEQNLSEPFPRQKKKCETTTCEIEENDDAKICNCSRCIRKYDLIKQLKAIRNKDKKLEDETIKASRIALNVMMKANLFLKKYKCKKKSKAKCTTSCTTTTQCTTTTECPTTNISTPCNNNITPKTSFVEEKINYENNTQNVRGVLGEESNDLGGVKMPFVQPYEFSTESESFESDNFEQELSSLKDQIDSIQSKFGIDSTTEGISATTTNQYEICVHKLNSRRNNDATFRKKEVREKSEDTSSTEQSILEKLISILK